MGCKLKADTYEEHLAVLARELGLEPEHCSGMGTAASMENVSIKTRTHGDLAVTAIVTGGIETNGGRVGDPASWDEWANRHKKMSHGTINIILVIDANVPAGTLTRTLVTTTEAKTAAIQELMGGSNYSNDLATGSGTDGTIIVGNMDSPMTLTNAGKHSKLGEIIGLAVKEAVKEALYKQTGLSPKSQHCVLARLKRYGITLDTLWEKYQKLEQKGQTLIKPDFVHAMETLSKRDDLLAPISAVIHLMDQYRWELLKADETLFAIQQILAQISKHFDIEWRAIDFGKLNGKLVEVMLGQLSELLLELLNSPKFLKQE
jgi:adenosylcobinamide amidohydrolase